MIAGYQRTADLLSIHINTLRRAIKRASVYAAPSSDPNRRGKQYIISLSALTKDQLKSLIDTASLDPHSTSVKSMFLYNADKTVLLKAFKSVNEAMAFSKRSGRDLKNFCLSGSL